jgi:hypothetical protein
MPMPNRLSIVGGVFLLCFASPSTAQVPAEIQAQPPAQNNVKYPPFALADVGFTADCNPNAALRRLLKLLTGSSREYKPDETPDIDGPLYDAVFGETSHKLMLDAPADWNGLKFRGIELYAGIERGPVNYTMLFEDGPQATLAAWNKLGWKLKPVDETRDVEGLEGYASIGVSTAGEGASVTCWRD